ncbi:MAG: hypothetical protein HC900_03175 [Methylacidiphilales bacterium]|nr:hypothetical protein [Candidatus Methylacidiphilales bacterium]
MEDKMPGFLAALQHRFQRSNEKYGDFVPWALDDKLAAYDYVNARSFAVPRHQRTSTASEAIRIGREFGRMFVVKESHRHSTNGVYVIEVLNDDVMLDYISLRPITLAEIEKKALRRDGSYWFVEECLCPTMAGIKIPLDYKLYTFKGRVALVIQIDRNSYPPRVAMFDGAWFPLEVGHHLDFDEKRMVSGKHVLPLYAPRLTTMARHLSRELDTAFVSVDCYDTINGPVFGEFTFAPGAPHVKSVKFNQDIIEKLDKAMAGEAFSAFSGIDVNTERLWATFEDCDAPITDCSPEIYSRWAFAASLGDKRYGRLMTASAKSEIQRHFALCSSAIGRINGDFEMSFSLARAAILRRDFVNGSSRSEQFYAEAMAHYERLDVPWARARQAELRLMSGDESARNEIMKIAETGYGYAIRLLDALEKNR